MNDLNNVFFSPARTLIRSYEAPSEKAGVRVER